MHLSSYLSLGQIVFALKKTHLFTREERKELEQIISKDEDPKEGQKWRRSYRQQQK